MSAGHRRFRPWIGAVLRHRCCTSLLYVGATLRRLLVVIFVLALKHAGAAGGRGERYVFARVAPSAGVWGLAPTLSNITDPKSVAGNVPTGSSVDLPLVIGRLAGPMIALSSHAVVARSRRGVVRTFAGFAAELARSGMNLVMRSGLSVQVIRTSWTKLSRGMPRAGLRSGLPESARLPDGLGDQMHELAFTEGSGFSCVERLAPIDTRIQVRRGDGGRLLVSLNEASFRGVPRRGFRPQVPLDPGSWVRWRYNWRWPGKDTWFYEDEVWNIAHGVVDTGAFLGEPGSVIDERVSLH